MYNWNVDKYATKYLLNHMKLLYLCMYKYLIWQPEIERLLWLVVGMDSVRVAADIFKMWRFSIWILSSGGMVRRKWRNCHTASACLNSRFIHIRVTFHCSTLYEFHYEVNEYHSSTSFSHLYLQIAQVSSFWGWSCQCHFWGKPDRQEGSHWVRRMLGWV